MAEEEYEIDPTIASILERQSLNWIFVGGKGGVGKTTTACAIAYLYAKMGKKTLLISTDPAHNISDALVQQIGDTETKIEGIDNLFAMEISSKKGVADLFGESKASLVAEIIAAIPGIDEAISFSELMKQIKNMKYDKIIFDTAPTGHTLKFLGFPSVLEKGIEKAIEIKDKFSGVLSHFSSLFDANHTSTKAQGVLSQLEETKAVVEAVNAQFKNPALTTFICVCIPEFLSVYETSRLVEVLNQYKIHCETMVVNQVLFPEKESNCNKCLARVKMQRKYLLQISNLFDSFNIITTPLMDEEIRGFNLIEQFSTYLLEPFEPDMQ